MWNGLLCPAQMLSLSAEWKAPSRKFKERSRLAHAALFHWESLHSVTRSGLFERTEWRTVCSVTHLCIFLSKKLKVLPLWALLPYRGWCTHDAQWKPGRMKEEQRFLLLSCSISFEENKLCLLFSCSEELSSPFSEALLFQELGPLWTALLCLVSDS